jgi:tRNA A37 methylthiotransferase MiaB
MVSGGFAYCTAIRPGSVGAAYHMAAYPWILPYLGLPIRHGHDEMLRRVGRRYGHREIVEAVH